MLLLLLEGVSDNRKDLKIRNQTSRVGLRPITTSKISVWHKKLFFAEKFETSHHHQASPVQDFTIIMFTNIRNSLFSVFRAGKLFSV